MIIERKAYAEKGGFVVLAALLLFFGAMLIFLFSEPFATCAICSLAMPLELSTIIGPDTSGKDAKVASCVMLVSHVLACVTIPLIFTLFEQIVKKEERNEAD